MKRLSWSSVVLLAMLSSASAQWKLQASHTDASLRGIHNVNGAVAWASGTGGTVLRTVDGGEHWQACAIPAGAENLDFRGVQAFDEKIAIVMSSGEGKLSRLYKTTDGCASWKLILANPDKDGFWSAMQFQSDAALYRTPGHRRGVVVGDPVEGKFVIYTTADSGESWQLWGPKKTHRPANASAGETLFAASNSEAVAPGVNGPFAFVTGGAGGARLFLAEPHSPFDVSSWWAFRAFKLPMAAGPTSGAFSLAARRNPKSGLADLMIVGGDYKNSQNGAAVFVPWRPPFKNSFSSPVIVSEHPPHGYRSSVAYDPASRSWITVGPTGTDVSRDDGRNWRPLTPGAQDSPDADRNWNAISLPFVVGPGGRIGKLRENALNP